MELQARIPLGDSGQRPRLPHKLVAVEQNSRNNFCFFAEIAAHFLHNDKLRRSLHYGMTRRLRRSIWLGVKAAIQRPQGIDIRLRGLQVVDFQKPSYLTAEGHPKETA